MIVARNPPVDPQPAFPTGLLPTAAAALLLFGIGPNLWLAILAVAVLITGARLSWRPGESPILLFIFTFQWLQGTILVFYANWLAIDVGQLSDFHAQQSNAIVLTCIALVALAIGMRLGAGRWTPQAAYQARTLSNQRSEVDWAKLYALAFVGALFCEAAARLASGLMQPMLAVASLKWAFYWMLAYATFSRRGANFLYFLAAFMIELALGVGSYFSDFKTVMFFTLFAALAAQVKISFRSTISLLLLGAILIAAAVAWSAIKMEYRAYVSGGERVQMVRVGYIDRLSKLAELISAIDDEKMAKGYDSLLKRLAYVELFGVTLAYVPRVRPHEDGAIWIDAVSRPFMPRLLFPNKAIIDDSERTNAYTGLDLYGMEQGTSISLGYVAESYIDFGEFGMMVPIVLLGIFYGRVYRGLVSSSRCASIFGMGLASSALYPGAFLDASITKSFGAIVVALLVTWILVRFAIPRFIPWLQPRAFPQR